MKQSLTYLLFAAVLAMTSCGQKTENARQSSDSVKVADTTAVTEEKTFYSPDLQLNNLRGKVKQVSTTIYDCDKNGHRNFESNKTLLTFDDQGNWTANEKARFTKASFKRNAKGQISALKYKYIIDREQDYGYEYEYEYSYNTAGYLIEMNEDYVGELCGSMTHRYSYNKNNEVTVITISGVGDGVGLEEKIEITIKECDEHGNWIRALYKDTSTTTEEYGDEGQTSVSTFTNYSLHIRKIEYYE